MMYSRRTRRQFLASAATCTFAAASPWPWALAAGDAPATENFKFIAVNDLHYREQADGPWTEQLFKQMSAHEGVEFCLFLGDLVEDGRLDQLHAVRDIIHASKLETHIVVGNHDYSPPADRANYEAVFPDTLHYTFTHGGWQFVACDTTQGRQFKDTAVAKETIDWLHGETPKLDAKRPTVLFTHFPMGFLVPAAPGNRMAVLNAFDGVNLQAVFNGHFHGRTTRSHDHATITTNQCCSRWHPNHDGSKEKGYFFCEAKDGQVSRTFFEVKTA
jgi:predicted phosphodiesterase